MKRVKLIILFILVCFPTFVYAAGIDDNRDAVLATADAYYQQKEQMQYDSYKKNINCTPEDATSNHYCYANCAGFVYMVYKNALNKEVPKSTDDLLDYAANSCNGSRDDVNGDSTDCNSYDGMHGTVRAYSGDVKEDFDTIYYSTGLKKFLLKNLNDKNIKPADIIVWESTGGAGHVMIVESVDKANKVINIIQVGGGDVDSEGRYDYLNSKDIYEPNGTVSRSKIVLGDLYATVITKVKKDGQTIELKENVKGKKKVAIIGFATTKDSVSDSAKIRDEFEDITIAKVVSKIVDEDGESRTPVNQSYARVGDTLTYFLRIKNNNDYSYDKRIVFEENIDVINGNENALNKKISFKIDKVKSYVESCETNGSVETCNSDTSYVKCEMFDKKITCYTDGYYLKSKHSIVLKYNVKIDGTDKDGNEAFPLVLSTGTVGERKNVDGEWKYYGIKSSTIETSIGKGLSADEKKELKKQFFKYKENKYDNKNVKGTTFINNLYKKVFSSLNYNPHINSIFPLSYDYSVNKNRGVDKLFIKYTSWGSSEIAIPNMYLYSNFYGLQLSDEDIVRKNFCLDNGINNEKCTEKNVIKKYTDKNSLTNVCISGSDDYDQDECNKLKKIINFGYNKSENVPDDNYLSFVKASLAWDAQPKYELYDRARTLTSDMLEDGDVILFNTNSTTLGYIYFNNGSPALYRYRYDSADEKGEFVVINGDDLVQFLHDLIGKNYIILRPYIG